VLGLLIFANDHFFDEFRGVLYLSGHLVDKKTASGNGRSKNISGRFFIEMRTVLHVKGQRGGMEQSEAIHAPKTRALIKTASWFADCLTGFYHEKPEPLPYMRAIPRCKSLPLHQGGWCIFIRHPVGVWHVLVSRWKQLVVKQYSKSSAVFTSVHVAQSYYFCFHSLSYF